jgi:S1-C subfamily serine protease
MRCLVFLIFLGLFAHDGFAQESVVQQFSAVDTLTTPPFQVQDKWEIQWVSKRCLSVTVVAPDGTVVAGAAGYKGSLYQAKGGTFSLQIAREIGGSPPPWKLSVVQMGSVVADPNAVVSPNYIPPLTASSAAATAMTEVPPPPTAPVVASTPSSSGLKMAGKLSEDQAHAIVVIKGDVAEGTGFLVRTRDGPAVITNLHVLAANPHVHIFMTTGAEVTTLGLKGASDRDLAMFSIQDEGYTYLDISQNIKNTVQNGDEVITPGNSEGGEVVLDTHGKVLGIGPQQIEFDNPIYHGNSGGPVIHVKTGKVIAVVTQARKVNISDELDKASFESKNSAIGATMRYFGYRIDTVPQWETYDWNRYLTETIFLKNFQEQSRELDSFLNGATYEKQHAAVAGDEGGPPDAHYYLRNPKIGSVSDTYHSETVNAEMSERLDAARELVMSLQGLADTDMEAIQNPSNFYSFDRVRAAQEIQYRKALRTEIDNFGGKVSDMGH